MKSELVAVEHINVKYKKVTKLEWFIGLLCNFSCSYCAEHKRSGFGETQKMIDAVDLIVERLEGRDIELLLGGGEPSIHPGIEEICEHIHSKGIFLTMITNGARSPELYVNLMKFVGGFTFSIHFEMDYERTINTIYAVHERAKNRNEGYVNVNMMMVPGYFKEIKVVIDELQKRNIRYSIRRIRPLFDKNNLPILNKRIQNRKVVPKGFEPEINFKSDWGYYSEDELTFMNLQKGKMVKNTKEYWQQENGTTEMRETNANEILLRKENRFEGWSCTAGIERLHIYPKGDVFRSTCKVGGKLGNIFSDFNFPQEPVICTEKRCTCAWAVNLSKSKYKNFSRAKGLQRSMGQI